MGDNIFFVFQLWVGAKPNGADEAGHVSSMEVWCLRVDSPHELILSLLMAWVLDWCRSRFGPSVASGFPCLVSAYLVVPNRRPGGSGFDVSVKANIHLRSIFLARVIYDFSHLSR